MADPRAGYLEGDYATKSAEKRGERRALEKAGHLTYLEPKEVVKPEPDPEWHHAAKTMWTLASMDEAADLWSSGDWLRLFMLCNYYSAEMSSTYADGTPRTPKAMSMEVIFNQLTELRLSARSKQADGYLIDRSEPEPDPAEQIRADVAALFEDEDDEVA
ncbi:hypothetical protein QWJ41_04205 [Nocardioides sp. SOB44]|uniref:Terminase small subunit n=1 Tax=Nocardioides cremeus TaxID=3058044 RepID=A0ABT8TLR0_9ACTN|nr:hypothetical protein [Nocardioides cremeus]MDO3394909.1 hypothetical protein [Nocardioides cremeus]